MSRAAASLRADLAEAAREEGQGWQRPGPLLAGLLVFGLAAPFWRQHPAWALSLGLWLGHAASDGLAGLLARRLPPSVGLPLALALGTALGWGVEQALTPLAMNAEARLTRGWLHATFGALLLGLPLLQGLRRLRALRRVEQDRARLRAELQMLQAQIEPHFLFNTLATLRSFIRQGSDKSLPLLDAVSSLFDIALTRSRQAESTLGQTAARLCADPRRPTARARARWWST
ncbi:MAG: histidine kinase [Rubrivivax sp.]|nr:MAG: histidine kinase [Rubrivivax sp.]